MWPADDSCTDSFTLNQVARMHCYLDLIYQTWQPASKPSPVAMPLQVVEQHHNSITLEWFQPISGHFYSRWNVLHLVEGMNPEKNLTHLAACWIVVQPTWFTFGLYLSCLVCLSVDFLEKWDQCVTNAPRGGFSSSTPPIPPPPDPATPLDTGPLERLKVWYQTYFLHCHVNIE